MKRRRTYRAFPIIAIAGLLTLVVDQVAEAKNVSLRCWRCELLNQRNHSSEREWQDKRHDSPCRRHIYGAERRQQRRWPERFAFNHHHDDDRGRRVWNGSHHTRLRRGVSVVPRGGNWQSDPERSDRQQFWSAVRNLRNRLSESWTGWRRTTESGRRCDHRRHGVYRQLCDGWGSPGECEWSGYDRE